MCLRIHRVDITISLGARGQRRLVLLIYRLRAPYLSHHGERSGMEFADLSGARIEEGQALQPTGVCSTPCM